MLIRRVLLAAIAVVMVLPDASFAGGFTVSIATDEFSFTPRRTELTSSSTTDINWYNQGSKPHVVKNGALPLDETIPAGDSIYLPALYGPGTYTYVCTIHRKKGMRGALVFSLGYEVPGGTAQLGEVITFDLGPGVGQNVDVQMRRPGSRRFTTILADRTDEFVTYVPPATGTYRFRARSQLGFGPASGWSPTVEIVVG